MAVIKMEEFQEFPTLPVETILHLKVDSTSVREVKSERGNWSKLEFKFKILGIQASGDGSPLDQYDVMIGQHIWGSVPFKFNDSPENKLKQWVEALLGMEVGIGFELETELLENKQCRGITGQYEKRNIDPRTGKPFKSHQIDSLLPVGGQPLQHGGGWGASAMPAAPQPLADPWAAPAAVATAPAASSVWGEEPPF